MNRITVVCFTFPPFAGIGGRRWAKFVKYLRREGLDVEVVAALKDLNATSPWTVDIEEYRHKITYLKAGYPAVLMGQPANFIERWRYRMALIYVKLRFRRGNYFDHSNGFGRRLYRELEKRIGAGCNAIIISVGPFAYTRSVIPLKKKYPHVKFILDYRDPWSNNHTSFGFRTITEKRRKFEEICEKNVIESCDAVITVSDEMQNYLKQITQRQPFFETISNGFDREDFEADATPKSGPGGGIRFVLTGTLYLKAEHIFEEFCEAVRSLAAENLLFKNQAEFVFFGEIPSYFYAHSRGLENQIKYGGKLALDEVYKAIDRADICMLFLTDDLLYSRSTKFYEYVAMKKPIAVFSKGGGTGQFAEENGIGFNCSEGKIKLKLLEIYYQITEGRYLFPGKFPVDAFDVKYLSDKIGKLIEKC